MLMQGCVISCGTVVFFQKSRNLSRSLLTNNNFYCGIFKKYRNMMVNLKSKDVKRSVDSTTNRFLQVFFFFSWNSQPILVWIVPQNCCAFKLLYITSSCRKFKTAKAQPRLPKCECLRQVLHFSFQQYIGSRMQFNKGFQVPISCFKQRPEDGAEGTFLQ